MNKIIEEIVHKLSMITPQWTLCGELVKDVFAAVRTDSMVTCPKCHSEMKKKICSHCSGQGQVTHDGYMPPTTCKPCKGTGRV